MSVQIAIYIYIQQVHCCPTNITASRIAQSRITQVASRATDGHSNQSVYISSLILCFFISGYFGFYVARLLHGFHQHTTHIHTFIRQPRHESKQDHTRSTAARTLWWTPSDRLSRHSSHACGDAHHSSISVSENTERDLGVWLWLCPKVYVCLCK